MTPTTGTMPARQETKSPPAPDIMEQVLIKGDLAKLSEHERVDYYNAVCKSLGLNPLTRPFDYITLNGRLQLYAKRDACDQLRKIYGISLKIVSAKINDDGIYIVEAQARTPDGREDMDIGAVALADSVKSDLRANLILKAVTKAKRRVTLSICGLGFLDETEIEDIPSAAPGGKFLNPSARPPAAEELSDEISSFDNPAPAASPETDPCGTLLFTLAREKAKQGEAVFNEWFKEQTKEAKAWLREHKAELVALYPR